MVRVLPDVSGLEKTFDYYCPPQWADKVSVGSMVRVDLHGRRVPGWIVELDSQPPSGVHLRPLTRFSSEGPSGDVVDLARWTAARWSGPLRAVLKSASPSRAVRSLPTERVSDGSSTGHGGRTSDFVQHCLDHSGITAVQVSPNTDPLPFALAAASSGPTLVVVPEGQAADRLVSKLRRQGIRVGRHPHDWVHGLTGAIVVGQRSAVLAPMPPRPGTILVLDDHAESMQEERVPTWHAADVAVERSRRAGGRCLLVGPMPGLRGRDGVDNIVHSPRSEQRSGWPIVELVDRRNEEPRLASTLVPPRVVDHLRNAERALLILNRKGRSQMLACSACTELVRSTDGRHLMVERDGGLEVVVTGERRPLVCASCGSTRLKRLRPGVSRVAEELEALLGRPVGELSSESDSSHGRSTPAGVVVGTEAALHRLEFRPEVVAFLDIDQELFAPRFRAGEQAMTLLIRAARLLGGRQQGGRLVALTRAPDHAVLRAALSADIGAWIEGELENRRLLALPPFAALAELSGGGAEQLAQRLVQVEGLNVVGPRPDGRYLATAPSQETLSEALTSSRRPGERVRVAVDPRRA